MPVAPVGSSTATFQPYFSQVPERTADLLSNIDADQNIRSNSLVLDSSVADLAEQQLKDVTKQQRTLEFFSALIETQEQFIRSFEDISDVPRQPGALFQKTDESQSDVTNLVV